MRKTFATVALASVFGLFAITADALPLASSGPSSDSMITQIAQGCGPGMHRGPGGMCRPLFSCPRGWHPGPHGRQCFRNR